MNHPVWVAVVVFVFGLAACHPPARTVATPSAAPPVPGIDYTWKIIGHVMLPSATIDERDAVGWNGREITVTRSTYASPFQGTCEQSGRVRRNRELEDIIVEVNAPRSVATDYNLSSPVVEYRLTCRQRERPPLAMYVSTDRAMTCFSGVCYFLRR
jgi:hypothetical protein